MPKNILQWIGFVVAVLVVVLAIEGVVCTLLKHGILR